ncbi:MAG: hypothetical protein IPL86_11895 [Flavobacteriales bacterium]|nr:hypothetical protein [Flavobacteriales bacterium]
MPTRSATSDRHHRGRASTAGTGGGVSIRGSRSDNTYYYIDGVKVPPVPAVSVYRRAPLKKCR